MRILTHIARSAMKPLFGSFLLSLPFAMSVFGQTCVLRNVPANQGVAATGGAGSFSVITTGQAVCPWASVGSPSGWLIPSPGQNTATASGTYIYGYTMGSNPTANARNAAMNIVGANSGSWTNYQIQVLQQGTSPSQMFSDVPLSSSFADYINLLKAKGVTSGCSVDGPKFCPNDVVSRAQMAALLIRSVMKTEDFTYTATPYFTDVPSGDPMFKYVQKLRDLGITLGCNAGGTQFCPAQTVTRAQMALFLARGKFGPGAVVAGLGNSTAPYFTDVPVGDGSWTSIQKLRDFAITSGCTATTFCPNDGVTRAQAAVFLIRTFFTDYYQI